jgi:hypothetical protein
MSWVNGMGRINQAHYTNESCQRGGSFLADPPDRSGMLGESVGATFTPFLNLDLIRCLTWRKNEGHCTLMMSHDEDEDKDGGDQVLPTSYFGDKLFGCLLGLGCLLFGLTYQAFDE